MKLIKKPVIIAELLIASCLCSCTAKSANLEIQTNDSQQEETQIIETKTTNSVYDSELEDKTTSMSENDLKTIIEAYGNILLWEYADYDANGKNEAFAVTATYCNFSDSNILFDGFFFIDSEGDITFIDGDAYNDFAIYQNENGSLVKYYEKGFFWFDYGAGGSGWKTAVYSVKNGIPYKLDVSQQLQGFYYDDELNRITTTQNDFSNGAHKYPSYELVYDNDTQQFSIGEKIVESSSSNSEESTDISGAVSKEPFESSVSISNAKIVGEYNDGGSGYMFRLDVNGSCSYWIAEITEQEFGGYTNVKTMSDKEIQQNNYYITGGSCIESLSAIVTPYDANGNAGSPYSVSWNENDIELQPPAPGTLSFYAQIFTMNENTIPVFSKPYTDSKIIYYLPNDIAIDVYHSYSDCYMVCYNGVWGYIKPDSNVGILEVMPMQ